MRSADMRRLARIAGAMQREVNVLTALRQQGQGHCHCGAEGTLYTLAGAPPPARRCLDCWTEYSAHQGEAPEGAEV